MYYQKIILCQPDSGKGCCACCGLFNLYDISMENLTRFLGDEWYRFSLGDMYRALEGKENPAEFRIRDSTSYICPYQAFIDESRPGCLLHPGVEGEKRDVSLFGSRICGDFLCPAHEILDDELKGILIDNIHHWYYYSIAIIDPESFLWIVNCMKSRFDVSFQDDMAATLRSEILGAALKIHAEFLHAIRQPIFFYSVSEYNLGKKGFSLLSTSERMRTERERIVRRIAEIMKG